MGAYVCERCRVVVCTEHEWCSGTVLGGHVRFLKSRVLPPCDYSCVYADLVIRFSHSTVYTERTAVTAVHAWS